jgi:hypothetical protein
MIKAGAEMFLPFLCTCEAPCPPKSSLKLENFNPNSIKSGKSLSHFRGSNSRLLCKSLSLLESFKILKFAKDRVVSRVYDNSRGTASKMQLRTSWGRSEFR